MLTLLVLFVRSERYLSLHRMYLDTPVLVCPELAQSMNPSLQKPYILGIYGLYREAWSLFSRFGSELRSGSAFGMPTSNYK